MKAIIVFLFLTIVVVVAMATTTMAVKAVWDNREELKEKVEMMVFEEYEALLRTLEDIKAENEKKGKEEEGCFSSQTADALLEVFQEVDHLIRKKLENQLRLQEPCDILNVGRAQIQRKYREVLRGSEREILQLIGKKQEEKQMIYDELDDIRLAIAANLPQPDRFLPAKEKIAAVSSRKEMLQRIEKAIFQEAAAAPECFSADVKAASRRRIRDRLAALLKEEVGGRKKYSFFSGNNRKRRENDEIERRLTKGGNEAYQPASQKRKHDTLDDDDDGNEVRDLIHNMIHDELELCDAAGELEEILQAEAKRFEGDEADKVAAVVLSLRKRTHELQESVQQYWTKRRSVSSTQSKPLGEGLLRRDVLYALGREKVHASVAKAIWKHARQLRVRREARELQLKAPQFQGKAAHVAEITKLVEKAKKAEFEKIARIEDPEPLFCFSAIRLGLARSLLEKVPKDAKVFKLHLDAIIADEEKAIEREEADIQLLSDNFFGSAEKEQVMTRLANLGVDFKTMEQIRKKVIFQVRVEYQKQGGVLKSSILAFQSLRRHLESEIAALEAKAQPQLQSQAVASHETNRRMGRGIWVAAGLSSLAVLSIAAIALIFWKLERQKKAGQKEEASFSGDSNLGGGIESQKHFVW